MSDEGLTRWFVRREFIFGAREYSPRITELFDRWLDEELAEAWDKGFADGVNHDLGDWENAPAIINNPYRRGEDS